MRKYLLLLLIFLLNNWSYSSNLNIQNVSMPTANTVRFSISWDNSWYINTGPNNWDAIWIIVKFQDCSSPTKVWRHAQLSDNSLDHSSLNSFVRIDAVTDKRGVFIRRPNIGSGSIPLETVDLTLATGQSPMPQTTCNIEVIGFEMVAVPQGSFAMGSGAPANSDYTEFNGNMVDASNNNSTISADFFRKGTNISSKHNAISPTFPKGYDAFYCMKYEITQIQYVTFLNQLSLTQQRERVNNNPKVLNSYAFGPSNRNSIKVISLNGQYEPVTYGVDLVSTTPVSYNQSNDGLHIACNFLNFEDLKAFLDWAALRPMTEFEYEKAARGTLPPVPNEYIYGGTNPQLGSPPVVYSSANSNQLSNPGTGSEVPQFPTGHIAYGANSSSGPLRVGFAATNATSRISAAASYYGILDLAGNVNEQVYMVGPYTDAFNIYDGKLGDGRISQFGYSNEETWPGEFSSMCRGGSYTSALYSISQRLTSTIHNVPATSTNATPLTSLYTFTQDRILSRSAQNGGRGVRQF